MRVPRAQQLGDDGDGEPVVGAEVRGRAGAAGAQPVEDRGEAGVVLPGQVVERGALDLLEHLAQAVEPLHAAAVARVAVDVGDLAVAEAEQVGGDRRARLVVGAADLVDRLERVEPALAHDRHADGVGALERGAVVRPADHQAGAGARDRLEVVGLVRPVDADGKAESLRLALHAALDLHVQLAVDDVGVVEDRPRCAAARPSRALR